jgi:hypothetical protein
MNDYDLIRNELLSLKEKSIRVSPQVISKLISQKIKSRKTKKLIFTFGILSLSLILILILRRKS